MATNPDVAMEKARRRFLMVWTAVGAILLTGAAVYLINILSVPIGILLWTLVIVFCLRGTVNKLESKGVPRPAGTGIAYLLMFAVLAIVSFLMLSPAFGFGELFTALETGTVDGQDNGMVTVVAQSFQEVQKYLYETNHIVATLEIIGNKDAMSKLTEEQQQIVRDAAKATAEQAWEDYIASVDTDRETIEAAGVTVTQMTEAERAKMIEKIQPTLNELLAANDWAPALIEKIEAVQ